MIKILQVKFETEKGERTGFFIKVLKGYVPVQILDHLELLEVTEEKEIEINEITGEIKI